MAGRGSGNSRNGYYPKTVRTEVGDVRLEVPRDRNGSFEPATVPVGQRRLAGLDQAIISLYAKGLTTGDIAAHLEDVTGQRVDRSTISRITDAITDDMAAWQSRPLDTVYPVLLVPLGRTHRWGIPEVLAVGDDRTRTTGVSSTCWWCAVTG